MNKSAIKTPLRSTSLKEMARVNDLLCLTLFMHEEVALDWGQIAQAKPHEASTAAFPQNRYARRIRVSMERLVEFRVEQLNMSLGVSFAFAVEQLLVYVESVLRLWGEVGGVPITFKEPWDEKLGEAAEKFGDKGIDSDLIRTVKYLRLRRNHIIHAADELSGELSKAVKYDAPLLKKYWAARTQLPGVDFSKAKPQEFTPEECMALVKLARICVEHIDDYVAKQLPDDATLREVDAWLLQEHPELQLQGVTAIARRVRKVKAHAFSRYGLRAKPEQVTAAITTER